MLGMLLPASGRGRAGAYKIARSLRFNNDDGAYLSRVTGAVPTNVELFTESFWVKRGNLALTMFTHDGPALPTFRIMFNTVDQLEIYTANPQVLRLKTAQAFRDVTAWGHFVVIHDALNATPALRLRIFYNGLEITNFATDVRSGMAAGQNTGWNGINKTNVIGRNQPSATQQFDGLLADLYNIDGQAVLPSAFGVFDPITGVWGPIKYTGTYGAQGWHLDFADNSGATSATIGKDRSGNNNDFVPNNISVVAGTGNDSLTDSPTDFSDSEVHGNFCTMSQIYVPTRPTLSDGNLKVVSSAAWKGVGATQALLTGKWYWEVESVSISGGNGMLGLVDLGKSLTGAGSAAGCYTWDCNWHYWNNGVQKNNGPGFGWASPCTVMFAYDADTRKIWYGKNGVWNPLNSGGAAGDPANGLNEIATLIDGKWSPYASIFTGTVVFNFGQRPFLYAPPAGFKAICTQNFAVPAVKNPQRSVAGRARAGTGLAGAVSGLLFRPEFIRTSKRTNVAETKPVSTLIRGPGLYKPVTALAEAVDAQAVTAFNADGFSFGTSAVVNLAAANFMDLMFKSDPANGIQILSYVGDGNANRALPHTLGKKPTSAWIYGLGATRTYAWHKDMPGDTYFTYWGGAGASTPAPANANTPFGGCDAANFTVTANATNNLNAAGITYVAVLFADGPLVATGLYTGNVNTDGPILYCGFKPSWVVFFNSNNGVSLSCDAANPTIYNGMATEEISAGYAANGEAMYSGLLLDWLSNGFKLRNGTANFNGNPSWFFALAKEAGKYARAV